MKKVVALLLVLCVLFSGCRAPTYESNEPPALKDVEKKLFDLSSEFWSELGFDCIEFYQIEPTHHRNANRYFAFKYPFFDGTCEFRVYADNGIVNKIEFFSEYGIRTTNDFEKSFNDVDFAKETSYFSILPVALYISQYDNNQSLVEMLKSLYYDAEFETTDIAGTPAREIELTIGDVNFSILESEISTFCEVNFNGEIKSYVSSTIYDISNYIGQPAKKVFDDFGYKYEITAFNGGTGFVIDGVWFKFLDYLDWNAAPTSESIITEIFTDSKDVNICYGVKIGDSIEEVGKKVGINYYDEVYTAKTYLIDFDVDWMVDPADKTVFGATITLH